MIICRYVTSCETDLGPVFDRDGDRRHTLKKGETTAAEPSRGPFHRPTLALPRAPRATRGDAKPACAGGLRQRGWSMAGFHTVGTSRRVDFAALHPRPPPPPLAAGRSAGLFSSFLFVSAAIGSSSAPVSVDTRLSYRTDRTDRYLYARQLISDVFPSDESSSMFPGPASRKPAPEDVNQPTTPIGRAKL